MKKILIITCILFGINILIYANEISHITVKNSPTSNLDFESIYFHYSGVNYSFMYIDGNGISYNIAANIVDGSLGFEKDNISYAFDEVNYKQLYLETFIDSMENNSSIVLEAQNTTGSDAYGLIYITREYWIAGISQELMDTIEDRVYPAWDSIDSINGFTDIYRPDLTDPMRGGAEAYIISFDQDDPYESQYSANELVYQYVYNTSSTDYLEKVLDIDRNNQLVGFRYYSELNGQEYTIFIRPNN